MMTQLKMAGLAVVATLVAAGPALAQAAAPTNEATGMPYCSAKVQDKCIQKSDARRVEAEKKAAAKAM